ncbi:type II toxin-antitoxin system VapC family toxin [Candidatus Gottesmanbacteria bacterium]|nr:type II toxin-antitoxin system VapC family toxin [Candidatus Gottesmanbacteria bacterium]
MRSKIFIDTSAWLAVYIPTEKQHQRVSTLVKQAVKSGTTLYTSNYISDETITRLLYDTDWPITKRFIQYYQKSVSQRTLVSLWVDEQCETEALVYLEKYHEHRLSLTDATSIVLVKRYTIDAILTLDSDFTKVGLRVLQ